MFIVLDSAIWKEIAYGEQYWDSDLVARTFSGDLNTKNKTIGNLQIINLYFIAVIKT